MEALGLHPKCKSWLDESAKEFMEVVCPHIRRVIIPFPPSCIFKASSCLLPRFPDSVSMITEPTPPPTSQALHRSDLPPTPSRLRGSIDIGPNYRGLYNLYEKGTFDYEAWACQISQYQSDFRSGRSGTAQAGRFVDVVCFVTAVEAAVIGIWALRGKYGGTDDQSSEKKQDRVEGVLGSL
jgi:hypothetical protein